MKTTIKLALLASALLLALAGCKNNFTPTNPSPDSFAKNVEGGNSRKNPLQVKRVEFTGAYVGGGYRVTVSFNRPVDPEAAKNAITFYNLKMKDAKTIKGDTVTVSMDSVSDKNNTKDLHFKFPATANNTQFWIEVVGKELKAANGGQKLDQDGDGVEGEEDDDFYGTIFEIGNASIVYNSQYLHKGSRSDTYIKNMFTHDIRFLRAHKDDLTALDGEGGDLVTHISISNRYGSDFYSVEQYGVGNDVLVELIKKHIVVEQYAKNKWEKVATSFELRGLTTLCNKEIVSPIKVEPNVPLRVRVVDIKDINGVKSSKYDYTLKYTWDARQNSEEVLTTESGRKEGFSSLGADCFQVVSNNFEKKINVSFTIPDTLKKYDQGILKNIAIVKDTAGYMLEYKGFDTTTLTPENFQILMTGDCYYEYYNDGTINKRAWLVFDDKNPSNKTNRIVIDIIDFGLTHPTKYFAGTVNKFAIHYDSIIDDDKIQVQKDDSVLFSSITATYDAAHPHSAPANLVAYKSASLTKSLYLSLLLERYPENTVQQYIDSWLNTIKLRGSSVALRYGTKIPAYSLYISPKVKVAAFDGVFAGTTNKVTIGPLDFKQSVDTLSDDDPLLNDGWLKVNIAP